MLHSGGFYPNVMKGQTTLSFPFLSFFLSICLSLPLIGHFEAASSLKTLPSPSRLRINSSVHTFLVASVVDITNGFYQ